MYIHTYMYFMIQMKQDIVNGMSQHRISALEKLLKHKSTPESIRREQNQVKYNP